MLGFLVLLGGMARWLLSSLISIVASGLTAWFLTPVNSIVLGASGLIFGWLTYLIARGIWSRQTSQVVIGVLVLLVYGGLIWGVLPTSAGVSWQAHLGGAVGGVLAAWLLHRRTSRSRPDNRPARRATCSDREHWSRPLSRGRAVRPGCAAARRADGGRAPSSWGRVPRLTEKKRSNQLARRDAGTWPNVPADPAS